MGKRDRVTGVFAVALFLLSACSQVMQSYPGPELPSTKTALVQSGSHTQIVSLDGHAVTSETVSILPGPHTIVVRIYDDEQVPMSVDYAYYSLSDGSVDFIAEPGHRYVASVDVVASPFPISGENDSGFRWVGYIHDRTIDQIVAKTDYLAVGVWPRVRRSL